ncbi:hypothetical protein E2C01_079091 [Portunus trituberculatus]|uniref:Uncharacterized protein n=1 Tax=Portunus trituberculatus TaxID=210409 RepID=A0A5B7IVX3_PORTR|nr:hypothetical protein [Portunus trituberculatus]
MVVSIVPVPCGADHLVSLQHSYGTQVSLPSLQMKSSILVCAACVTQSSPLIPSSRGQATTARGQVCQEYKSKAPSDADGHWLGNTEQD